MGTLQHRRQPSDEYLRLIREAHERSARSLREAACLCDLDHSYIDLVLTGKRTPHRDVLIALCAYAWGLDLMETDQILLTAGFPPIGRTALRNYRQVASMPSATCLD